MQLTPLTYHLTRDVMMAKLGIYIYMYIMYI